MAIIGSGTQYADVTKLAREVQKLLKEKGSELAYEDLLNIKSLGPINDKTFDVYEFIPKALDVYSIEDTFIDYMREGKRVSTLFVTENGNHREGLLGIITAWDLHKIDK